MPFLKIFSTLLTLLIIGCAAADISSSAQEPPVVTPQTVSPHRTAMGFTPWPVDFNAAGLARTYGFIGDHANLIAHHFDGGIPWDEAAANTTFPAHLQNDWAYRQANTPTGAKVFVAVTPLNFERNGLAPAWTADGDNRPLPASWQDRALDDPAVIAAYTNYVRRVVAAFEPDYIAIGIEANVVISNAAALWDDYVSLNAAVYEQIKLRHPSLPVFTTVQYEHLRGIEDGAKPNLALQRPGVATLMQSSDLLALSTYRYGTLHPNPMEADYFDVARRFGKPIAIAESGAMSQPVRIFGLRLPASEADQARFVGGLLAHAVANDFPFVVNWVAIDFEPGLRRLPAALREIAKAWVHTGLETSAGEDKPALAIWDAYLRQSRP
ncbi:hypothetical protein [Yoonia sp.]|uniref:hypothetical protein n=1 Tax=Yoonia sp. TaxID=2212373 RepID=UPI002E0ABEF0|nr:hypothetical protein [Yoonia sp.]